MVQINEHKLWNIYVRVCNLIIYKYTYNWENNYKIFSYVFIDVRNLIFRKYEYNSNYYSYIYSINELMLQKLFFLQSVLNDFNFSLFVTCITDL